MRSYPLIRNNLKDVSPNVRDPEQVISRLSNFWDAHGISKQVLDPRGPFFDKFAAFSEDAASVPDTKPTTSRTATSPSPNSAELDHSGLAVGFEGGLSIPEMQALRYTIFDRSQHDQNESDLAYDEGLLEGIDTLSPIAVHRRTNFTIPKRRTPYSTSLETISYSKHSLDVPQSKSSTDFWNVYDNAVKTRRDALDPGKFGSIPYTWVRSNIDEILNSEEGKKNLKHFSKDEIIPHSPTHPNVFLSTNPRHVAVSFTPHRSLKRYEDMIDLSTGTWARLNRDEFFPS